MFFKASFNLLYEINSFICLFQKFKIIVNDFFLVIELLTISRFFLEIFKLKKRLKYI
jgi:hypothetical protein